MLSILLGVVGACGGVITIPVFPLGLESVFEDPLLSLEGLLSSFRVPGLSWPFYEVSDVSFSLHKISRREPRELLS